MLADFSLQRVYRESPGGNLGAARPESRNTCT